MEKDILEKYIFEHRKDFDLAVPKDQVWANIAQHLGEMEKDDLEQYIEQQRDAFDVATPDINVWNKVTITLDATVKDDLEQFIANERLAFDEATPGMNVWENVNNSLDLIEKDNLEEFILREREAFDTGIPSLKVWANIDKNLSQQKGRRITLWKSLQVAAAIVILLVAGGTVGSYMTNNTSSTSPQIVVAPQQVQAELINEIAPQFNEMEQFFNKEVDNKIQQLASYQHDSSVEEDLAQLDVVMEELKRELLKAPKGTEQQILNNLIESYKTKLAILERVLERVQTNKPIKTSNNEISI